MARASGSILLLCLPFIFLEFVLSADPAQLVEELPGQPEVGFKHYAGHIRINETAGRSLFYWFLEADQSNASSLPVVLWLNGGPGCSSVGAGGLSGNGAFRMNASGTGLTLNEYSWNKVANMIYLEVPYNTGFSYTNLYSDGGFWSDNQTAVDSLLFMIEFFAKFPELKNNEFYVAGESFAGHFIPTLATQILLHNSNNKNSSNFLNFKGFAIGNPSTDANTYDAPGNDFYLYTHAVISREIYEGSLSCNTDPSSDRCNNASSEIFRIQRYFNPYNLYFESQSPVAAITNYLNLPQVQAALHVETRPVRWSRCNPSIDRSYLPVDKNRSLLPVYRALFGQGLRIWIYSGDVDVVVSTWSTRSWIEALNLTKVTPWYTWNYNDEVPRYQPSLNPLLLQNSARLQAGGWSEIYSDMTFATVRGSGHTVPFDKPSQALVVFTQFLQGKPLPGF